MCKRSALLKICRQFPTIENYEAYREAVGQARCTLRGAKRRDWKAVCESLNHLIPTSEIWRMIKRFKNCWLVLSNPSGGGNIFYSNDADIRKCMPWFLLFSFPRCSYIEDFLLWLDSRLSLFMRRVANCFEVTFSSPSLDCIDYQLLKALPNDLLTCLLSILNQLFQVTTFLEQWFHSIIHLIPKPLRGVTVPSSSYPVYLRL